MTTVGGVNNVTAALATPSQPLASVTVTDPENGAEMLMLELVAPLLQSTLLKLLPTPKVTELPGQAADGPTTTGTGEGD